MTSINAVLASNLQAVLSQRSMSQSALAKLAGVSQKTISNYVNPAQRNPGSQGKEPSAKIAELEKIARALNMEVWELLRPMSPQERALYAKIESHYRDVLAMAANPVVPGNVPRSTMEPVSMAFRTGTA